MTTTALVPTATLESLVGEVVRLAGKAKADNTRRAYDGDWRRFESWCDAQKLAPMPAEPPTVALYLAALSSAGAKVSTIARAASAISSAHKTKGLESPTEHNGVREVLKGIRRDKGVAPVKKAPITFEDLRAMLAHAPDGAAGLRDRALLTIGFFTGSRRSELVALDVEDLAFLPRGLVVNVRHSKTDQEGRGEKKAIHLQSPEVCPFTAARAWLQSVGATTGPLFRAVDQHGHIGTARLSTRAVADLVKRYAAKAGLPVDRFSGHSLRAGLVTSGAQRNATTHEIMKQTGHRKHDTVMGYIRDEDLFTHNVTQRFTAAGVGR